jgi:hypothetical protein
MKSLGVVAGETRLPEKLRQLFHCRRASVDLNNANQRVQRQDNISRTKR